MGQSFFKISTQYQRLAREVGLDAEAVFEHPEIKVWRSIPERENATLDAVVEGKGVRLHVKRYRPTAAAITPAEEEVRGLELLQGKGIPTTPLAGYGRLEDGRSFLITEDLAGFRDAEKLVREGMAFERLLGPTAELSARVHEAGLHHRDLYLCHFFARVEGERVELRLIDAARVKALPGWPLGQRWVVKDLGQFWYSAQQAGATQEQLERWLTLYSGQRRIGSCALGRLQRAVEGKARWIAGHDRKLRAKQPGRNVSIPM